MTLPTVYVVAFDTDQHFCTFDRAAAELFAAKKNGIIYFYEPAT